MATIRSDKNGEMKFNIMFGRRREGDRGTLDREMGPTEFTLDDEIYLCSASAETLDQPPRLYWTMTSEAKNHVQIPPFSSLLRQRESISLLLFTFLFRSLLLSPLPFGRQNNKTLKTLINRRPRQKKNALGINYALIQRGKNIKKGEKSERKD